MNKKDVVKFFGGVVNTATALGIKHPAVCRWGAIIPEKQAMKIERMTHGELKYDPAMYQRAA
ncbi:Cro/CI family transcriptional regulator [Yersinia aldovae]|uniref:DNA-binding transcriptional regulator DicC n=1 Tax=Yersinia aldovae TaxID=29483 RepID=A0ABM9SSH8_YERAL|nr:Cro/CI family transcriptional regulator [Yersinia aldovae]CNK98652.1 DNA-binding transcriptional regulator DicC [Yersinia aldovae]